MRSSCIAAAVAASTMILAANVPVAAALTARPTSPGHMRPLAHPAAAGPGKQAKYTAAPRKPRQPAGDTLVIGKSHTGPFHQGQHGALYTITVSNFGTAATSQGATLRVTDTLPAGLTATSISGPGWTCALPALTCARTDALAPNTQFPPIFLTVDVADNAPELVTNAATLSSSEFDDLAAPITTQDPTRVDRSDDDEHHGQGKGAAPVNITVINQNNSSAHNSNHNTNNANAHAQADVKVKQSQTKVVTSIHITKTTKNVKIVTPPRHRHHCH